MKPLPYERRLREWMEAGGMRMRLLRYARPAAGGDTLAYRLVPPRPRARVLVAHGAGNDALFGLAGLCKELLRDGWEVFTFDLDGHGRGSTTRFAASSIGSALPAALAEARRERPDLPMHALGISLGGALLLAALGGTLAAEFASAVLIGAPLRVRFGWGPVFGEFRPALLRTALRERPHSGLWGMVPSFGPLKRGTYPLRLAEPAPGAWGYIGTINRLLEGLGLLAAAARVRLPVLLVYGTRDRVVPPEQGWELAGRIPRSELLPVAGGTHLSTPFAPVAVRRILAHLRHPAPEPLAHGRST